MFNATNSNAIISKSKNIFSIFCCTSRIYIKFGILRKTRLDQEGICFWNIRLQKVALFKCLKSPVSEHLWTVNLLKGVKDCLICTVVSLSYFLTTLQKNHLEKFIFSSIWNLETVNILTYDEKYSLFKRECLTQPMQMQLSPN